MSNLSLQTSLVVLAIYLFTKYPGIPGGDVGELVAETCHLGTAHPPGYPLYTIVSHAWIRLLDLTKTSSTPATDINVLSCILGSMTCYFMNKVVQLYMNTHTIYQEDKLKSSFSVHVPLAP